MAAVKVFDAKTRVLYIALVESFSFLISILSIQLFQFVGWNSFVPIKIIPVYDAYMGILTGDFGILYSLQNSIPFVFALSAGSVYFAFFFFGGKGAEAQKRCLLGVLKCPSFNFWLTFSAWFIAAMVGVFCLFLVVLKGNQKYSSEVFILFVLSNLLPLFVGLLIGILVYYTNEFINQKYFIPRYFSQGEVLEEQHAPKLSLRMRFLIMYVAVTVIPLLFVNALSFSAGSAFREISIFSLAFLLISFLVIRFLADSFREPLTRMDNYTRTIYEGDYSGELPVISSDELGRLSKSLNDMARGLAERDAIKDTFGKIVDPAVRDHLLRGNINLGGEYYTATVLFTDIRGFTSISEKLPAAQVVDLLNRYFAEVTAAIIDEGGMINKFVGDAVLALFGVPVSTEDHAARALRAALKIRERRERLNLEFEREGLPLLQSGIGIHSGTLVAGNIGSKARMEFTAIGDTVNVASRLESACKSVGKDLLFSEQTRLASGFGDSVSRVAEIKVKGRTESIVIYTIN